MHSLVRDEEFLALLKEVEKSLEFAKKLGLEKGVGGYIYQTLPIVLHSWLRNRDNLKQAIIDVVECGGDTDTTGAIVGSNVGANLKGEKPPQAWVDGIFDFPRDVKFIEKISFELTNVVENKKADKASSLSPLLIVFRNMLFLIIVIIVAFSR